MTDTDETDPRCDEEFVRRVSDPNRGTVTVVGVVHDHPSSVHRVRRLVDDVRPSVLALEVPSLAVSLYEQYASVDRTPPPFGGEMSAAIQAADGARVEGVDGPTPRFVWRLGRRLLAERASLSTVQSVVTSLGHAGRRAVVCRAAATLAGWTGVRLEVDAPVDHDVDAAAPPSEQASDERDQVRRARAVLDVFEPSRATRFRDATREAYMTDRVDHLRKTGDVLAVVGVHHLDALVEGLRERAADQGESRQRGATGGASRQ